MAKPTTDPILRQRLRLLLAVRGSALDAADSALDAAFRGGLSTYVRIDPAVLKRLMLAIDRLAEFEQAHGMSV